MIEPLIAFLPCVFLLAPQLLAKIFPDKRVDIKLPGIVRIRSREEPCSPEPGKNRSPLTWTQIRQRLCKAGDGRRFEQGLKRFAIGGSVKQTYHPKDGQLRTFTKPGLIRFHDFSGMGSLACVVSKVSRDFSSPLDISVMRIGKVASEQREREAMTAELVAGTPQLPLISFDTQRAKQLRAGVAGELFQVATRG